MTIHPLESTIEAGSLSAWLHGKLTVDGVLSVSTKVGVGVTSPTERLEIYDAAVCRIAMDSGGNNSGFKLLESGIARYSIASYDGGKFSIWDEVSSASRLFIDPGGNVGIGTGAPLIKLAIGEGNTGIDRIAEDSIAIIAGGVEGIKITEAAGVITTVFKQKTPASAAAPGVLGEICTDASYIYVCTATDTWKRIGVAAW